VIMRCTLLRAALTALFLTGLPASAFSAPSAAPVADAQLAKAGSVVDLMFPPSAMIEGNMKAWEASIARTLELDPAVSQLEAEFPGIHKAAIDAGRPIAREQIQIFVEKGRQDRIGRMARSLSPTELDEALAFANSPVGRRLIERMMKNIDVEEASKRMASAAFATGDTAVSPGDIKAMDRKAALKTAAETSAQDQLAIMRFHQTGAGKKLAVVGAEADLYLLELMKPDPAALQRSSDAMANAMLKFAEQSGKR